VISVVDRFLEHARIFYFDNGGKREVYLSSADWMPRNFQRRVEVMFPVDEEELRDRVVDEILAITLADNVKARRLLADGTYVRIRPEGGAAPLRSQYRFMELAREKAQAGPGIPGAGGGPYQVRTVPPPRGLPAGGGQAAAPSAVAAPAS
jgi:polyphosphate kinase